MRVVVNGWAWLPKANLTPAQIYNLRRTLTVVPVKVGEYPGETPEPILLFEDTDTHLGIPRSYFLANRRAVHQVDMQVTEGSDDWFPVEFVGSLRPEQQASVREVMHLFEAGQLGGIIQAKPGWGKTVCALAIVAALKVPTLVVVHKEFLMDQWQERIEKFLPGARVGRVQQDQCDFQGKTIVMGMVHSLAKGGYPGLWDWPGLVITDECHRIGARTWSVVPPMFKARYRLGFTATPRRKDLADDVFWHHIGPILFAGKEERLKPTVKRVWTNFKLVKTDRFNPQLASRPLLLRFLCASRHRNELIVDQLIQAIQKERKCMVLSERLEHLKKLEDRLEEAWPNGDAPPSVGWYVGGRTKGQLAEAAEAKVILATVQYAAEGLDIPTLDTLFLVTPMSDVEQAVGRILRPVANKKPPIVVDFRDDSIPLFEGQARKRDQFYRRIG